MDLFDTRADDWVYKSIPAKSWKYTTKEHYAMRKDYSKYPNGVVTHSEDERCIKCCNCWVLYSTDARRQNEHGQWVYVPINQLITYRAAINAYQCLVPCKRYISPL